MNESEQPYEGSPLQQINKLNLQNALLKKASENLSNQVAEFKSEIDKLKADNFFLENEKDGLIQENKKLRDEIQDLKDEMRVQSELNDLE